MWSRATGLNVVCCFGKCASSDNSVFRTLALCCRDAVGSVCDLYKLTTHDLDVLPVGLYMLKQIIWNCFQRTVHT